jgi:NifB/MoaA-like Fe-S oxidoreductase
VENFKYLGVIFNEDNNNHIDLQERIKMLTKHFMLQTLYKKKNISKKLKLRLNKTIIDKTLTYIYISETWTPTERDRKQLNIF